MLRGGSFGLPTLGEALRFAGLLRTLCGQRDESVPPDLLPPD